MSANGTKLTSHDVRCSSAYGNKMTIRRPTQDQLADIAAGFGFAMSPAEIAAYAEAALPGVQLYEAVDAMSDNLSPVRYPRTPGYRPEGEENKYNAWHVKVRIDGKAGSKLAGKRIALKDSICLAGVPMMNGSTILEGYIPEVDATIVTRILDAGGTIAGKAHCEFFACLAAAIRERGDRSTTQGTLAIRRVDRHREAPRS
jgi:amidase